MRNLPRAIASACVVFWTATSFAEPTIERQIGKAKLGMSIEEAKAAYPKIEIQVAHPDSTPPMPFHFGQGALPEKVSIGEIKDCDLHLQFFQEQLISITGFCPNKEAGEPALRKKYGEPTMRTNEGPVWHDSATSIVFAPKTGGVTLTDSKPNQAFQTLMMMHALGNQKKTPQAAGDAAPAITPQPAAP